MNETTISCIKADVGSIGGHIKVPEEMLAIVRKTLKEAKEKKLIRDFHVFHVGDDINTVISHTRGENDPAVHELAWNALEAAAAYAKKHKFYGAGQDLLSDAFSGNVKGLGPGVAEMTFVERKSDPLAVFACDKTEPAAFNLPLFKIFADPLSNAGLTIDPAMAQGFTFQVLDAYAAKTVDLKCPEEIYTLLALIGTTSAYSVKKIWRNGEGSPQERVAASVSAERLSLIAGKYVGKDDPVCVVRAQSGFPAMGEVIEGFATGHIVSGWMRGSHRGPLMPVAVHDSHPTRFDGPPRLVGLAFQVSHGVLHGPHDIFDDVSFDRIRQKCLWVADYLREHGPFEPHRLGKQEMEYTTLPQILESLKDRFKPYDAGVRHGSPDSGGRVRDKAVPADTE